MHPHTSLLEVLQGAIERTYRMDTGVREIHRHVVGDRGLRALYGDRPVARSVGGRSWPQAKVLVREAGGQVHATIYYPDDLIGALEERNPLHGLDARNLDPFAVFVEELDHFLTIADRLRSGRCVSLFELELHANVTKYVTTRHFLARSLGRPLRAGERRWLHWSLFEKLVAADGPAEVRARYRDADRIGRRWAAYLDGLGPRERLEALRGFHRLSAAAAVRRADAVARAA